MTAAYWWDAEASGGLLQADYHQLRADLERAVDAARAATALGDEDARRRAHLAFDSGLRAAERRHYDRLAAAGAKHQIHNGSTGDPAAPHALAWLANRSGK